MYKIIVTIAVLAFAILTSVTPTVAQEVYLLPQQSSTINGNVDVEIWVNASDFFGGQINLAYDSSCMNVTHWERTTTVFPFGGWAQYEGREWITFMAAPPTRLLSGNYMIGRLTLQSVTESEQGCETTLAFIEPSALFDDAGIPIPTTWKDGTCRCSQGTAGPTPPENLSDAQTPAPTETHSPIAPAPQSGSVAIGSTETPPLTDTEPPGHTNDTPLATPSPLATATPSTSSHPIQTPPLEGKRKLPGFEAAFAIAGLMASLYLLSKRGKRNDLQ